MMWTFHDCIGIVFFSSFCIQVGVSFNGKFTEMPSNVTAKEGQNIEMACAFQSGTSSVYLEIQWWFIKTHEERNASEGQSDTQTEIMPPDPDDEGTKISTVRVQGTDISHKLQISKVEKSDEGLYECRVTDANYGELREYKVQAHLQVNSTAQPRSKVMKKTAPLHLTDKKPRKANQAGAHEGPGSEQRVRSTSSSQTKSAKTGKHSHGSGTRIAASHGLALVLLACGFLRGALL